MKLAGVLGLGLARAGSVFEAIVASGSTLLDDLVSYWTLDEQSGTRADAVGDNDLTDNNTVLAVNRGPVGTVGSFVSANTEYLNLNAFTFGASYSVSMWLKATGEQSGAYGLLTCYNGWADDNQLALFGGDTSIAARVGDGGSSTYKDASITEGGGWDTIGWFNVVVTFDAATKVTSIYKNTAAGTPADALAGTPYRTAAPLLIGRLAATNQQWNGLIGPVGIWSRVLSSDDIGTIFNSGNGKRYADLTAAEKVDLVSYWNLDEVSGTRADAHGTNDLTDNNTVGSVNTGPLGTVASTTATNQETLSYIAAVPDLSTGWAASIWFYPVVTGGSSSSVLRQQKADESKYIKLYPGAGDDTMYARFNDGTNDTYATITGLTLNQWHHLVFYYNPTDRKAYAKLDGVAMTTGDAAAAHPVLTDATAFTIGNNGTTKFGPCGTWGRILTSGEITSLFAAGNGKRYADLTTAEKVGLVSYWNLDEASGTRVDAHGANDLTDNNTVLSTINAPPALDGAAASFVAANTEYLSRTDASIIDGGSDFTVNLWINANNVTGGKGVIGKWNTDGWMVYLNGGTLRLYNGASNFNGDTISAGQWYMITAWVSGTDGYIAVNNGTPVTADFTSLTPAAGTIPFNIGNYSSGGELWDGQMDEPAIWSRVLTADERAELFALGKGKFYDFS